MRRFGRQAMDPIVYPKTVVKYTSIFFDDRAFPAYLSSFNWLSTVLSFALTQTSNCWACFAPSLVVTDRPTAFNLDMINEYSASFDAWATELRLDPAKLNRIITSVEPRFDIALRQRMISECWLWADVSKVGSMVRDQRDRDSKVWSKISFSIVQESLTRVVDWHSDIVRRSSHLCPRSCYYA